MGRLNFRWNNRKKLRMGLAHLCGWDPGTRSKLVSDKKPGLMGLVLAYFCISGMP